MEQVDARCPQALKSPTEDDVSVERADSPHPAFIFDAT